MRMVFLAIAASIGALFSASSFGQDTSYDFPYTGSNDQPGYNYYPDSVPDPINGGWISPYTGFYSSIVPDTNSQKNTLKLILDQYDDSPTIPPPDNELKIRNILNTENTIEAQNRERADRLRRFQECKNYYDASNGITLVPDCSEFADCLSYPAPGSQEYYDPHGGSDGNGSCEPITCPLPPCAPGEPQPLLDSPVPSLIDLLYRNHQTGLNVINHEPFIPPAVLTAWWNFRYDIGERMREYYEDIHLNNVDPTTARVSVTNDINTIISDFTPGFTALIDYYVSIGQL